MRIALLLLLTSTALRAAEKPNIIFILADDLGMNDLACYGRRDHKTPNLDRLAGEGMKFNSAYAAAPVCSPSRAAILTGKHPARLHLTNYLPGRPDAASQKLLQPKTREYLPLEEVTLAERLKAEGYATACIGKWHLGGNGFGPKEQGFDVAHAGQANTEPRGAEGGKGEYDLTGQAIDFITANKDRPFFLYLAHNSPHIPLAGKRELVEKFGTSYNPTYAAMVNTLDDSVGLVLSTLDRLKLAEKTIVILTSDNGGLHVPEGKDDAATHNTPGRAGKGFLYEGGVRVPLLVRYPGTVAAGKESRAAVIGTDWPPTLLALAGVTTKDEFDGLDFRAALKGEPLADRTLYWHFPHYSNQGGRPGGALRDGDWKFIEHYEGGPLELYNLGSDPLELLNLTARFPGVVESYRSKLDDWRKSVAAQEPGPNPKFDAATHKAIYLDFDAANPKIAATAALTSEPLRAWRQRLDAAVKK